MAHIRDLQEFGRTSGKRWQVRYTTPDGKERSKTFTKKIEAERFKTSVEHSKLTGAYIDPQLGRRTVGEQGDIWYASTAGLASSSRESYESLLRLWIKPHLGDIALADLTRFQIRSWISTMISSGLSSRRAEYAHRTLSLILKSAVEDRRVLNNEASGVKVPKGAKVEKLFLTAEEVELLARECPAPYDVLIRFLAYGGLRRAEVVALRVDRIDLATRRLRIVETTDEENGKLITKPTTKSHEKRTVLIPQFICDELSVMIKSLNFSGSDYLFQSPEGGQLRWNNWHKRTFTPAATSAGLFVVSKKPTKAKPNGRVESALRPHDLRHTCASLMIRNGASIKAVQRQLGHESAVMTLDQYGHLFTDELDEIAEKMDVIGKKAKSEIRRKALGIGVVADDVGQMT